MSGGFTWTANEYGNARQITSRTLSRFTNLWLQTPKVSHLHVISRYSCSITCSWYSTCLKSVCPTVTEPTYTLQRWSHLTMPRNTIEVATKCHLPIQCPCGFLMGPSLNSEYKFRYCQVSSGYCPPKLRWPCPPGGPSHIWFNPQDPLSLEGDCLGKDNTEVLDL